MRGHEDWERTSGDRPLTHYKQSVASASSGPYVGRGPRGYRRPDSRIHEDVCELLTRHGQIDASDVDVSVEHGVVTLHGSVDGRHTKRLIEDVIDDVTGVKDVRNELSVDQTERGTLSRTNSADSSSYQARVRDDEWRRYTHRGESQPSATSSSEGEPVSQSGEGRFISSSGSQYRAQMREGMEAVGSDGASIGDVREISNNSFLVHRPTNRDVFVPFAGVRSMSGNWVMLNIRADEVDDQGWATPDLTGAPTGESGAR
jgi:hypothetical protein